MCQKLVLKFKSLNIFDIRVKKMSYLQLKVSVFFKLLDDFVSFSDQGLNKVPADSSSLLDCPTRLLDLLSAKILALTKV